MAAEVAQRGHRPQDRRLVRHALAAVRGEHLDRADALVGEHAQLIGGGVVPLDHATVQCRVAQPGRDLGALGACHVERALPGTRDGEVDDRGRAAEHRRGRALAVVVERGVLAGGEPDVAVRVDATGQHQPAACVDHRNVRVDRRAPCEQRGHHTVADEHVRRSLPGRVDDRAAADDEIGAHALAPR
jgi:hypothetical protein